MDGLFGLFARNPAGARLLERSVARGTPRPVRFRDEAVLLCADAPSLGAAGPGVIVGGGRIRNAAEVGRALGLGGAASVPRLLEAAWARWGSAASERLHGDWRFAAWNPSERRLLLARDPLGVGLLYYHCDERIFAFSSTLADLVELGLAPVEIDEVHLARLLVAWPARRGDHTGHRSVRRLPPAHRLEVGPRDLTIERYWRVEDTPVVRRPRREDYLDAFRALFDQAVRESLPETVSAASTLSGGLDSSAVTVTAAAILAERGRRLDAYTSVPVSDTGAYVGTRFGDEQALARETVRHAGNIDHHLIAAEDASPIGAMREALSILPEPQHAAGNLYWLLDLYRTAAANGAAVLLVGQGGNAGVSWNGGGDLFGSGPKAMLRRLRACAPAPVERLYRAWRSPQGFAANAIDEDFARRIELRRLRLDDPDDRPFPRPREQRLRVLQPQEDVGAVHAELAARFGLAVSDPTTDARVLAYCFSVPDEVFAGRWMIRHAMDGRLPDAVRLNQERGRQAADLAPRLRAHPDEMEAALDEIARGPASEYVSAAKLRSAWEQVCIESSPRAFRVAMAVLTRGVMVGLWVNALKSRRFALGVQ